MGVQDDFSMRRKSWKELEEHGKRLSLEEVEVNDIEEATRDGMFKCLSTSWTLTNSPSEIVEAGGKIPEIFYHEQHEIER